MRRPLPSGPCGCVQIRIPSVTGSLPIVRAVVQKMIEVHNVREEEAASIGLAIDEALANVIRHGYAGASDKIIDVCLECDGGSSGAELIVTIRHYGAQVDPATIKSRELSDVRPGGLGVHIISSVMDHVEYACPPDGGMTVKLVKRLRPAAT